MKARYPLEAIEALPHHSVFFDANILIYIFWPTTTKNKISESYSRILAKMLRKHFSLFTNTLVLSEVINRCLRLEYDKYIQNEAIDFMKFKFKDFRSSPEGINVQTDIFNMVKEQILCNFNIVDKCFNNKNITELLTINELDFNDKLIISNCIENNYLLITNDKDFIHADIDIFTSNPVLLAS